MSDNFAEILKKSKDGDIKAFMILISPYQSKIYGAALSIFQNEAEASQIAVKAIGSIYAALPYYNSRSSFSTWIWSIVSPYFKKILPHQKTGLPA